MVSKKGFIGTHPKFASSKSTSSADAVGDQVYAQAEALLTPTGPTTAIATWSVGDTTSLQNDTAYTFLYDLTVGQHAVTAVYIGDISNLGSTSAAVTQVRSLCC